MKNKKYAVIYAPTINVGDDIQTLAAINFLKKKGVTEYDFINREKLHEYDGEEVYLLMNGWFMDQPQNFPPSDKIKPIWISFHVAKPQTVTANLEYFNKQPPIGCRDQSTVDLLQKHGIEAYFTGCLSLFFDKVTDKNNEKYIIDINNPSAPSLFNNNLQLDQFEGFASLTTHAVRPHMSIQQRIQIAKEYYKIYSSAKLIVTSRIHVAMPCRALGTDCIFIHKNYKTDPRFKGLEGVLNGDVKYHHNTSAVEGEVQSIQSFFDDNQYLKEGYPFA